MATLVLSRASSYTYPDYNLPVIPTNSIPFGDLEAYDREQCCLEFDVDPATIDTSVPVNLEFKLVSATAGTKYIRRWKNAYPTTEVAMTAATALDDATNQVAWSDSGTATVTLNVTALIDDMVTAGQTTVLLGIPDITADVHGSLDNDTLKPGLTYTASGGGGGSTSGTGSTSDLTRYLTPLIKWGTGILSRNGALAISRDCCCCDCCGWLEAEGGPQLLALSFEWDGAEISTSLGVMVPGSMRGSGKGNCVLPNQTKPPDARFDFTIHYTNGNCLAAQDKPGYMILKHDPPKPGSPTGCCYWEIHLTAPDAPCMAPLAYDLGNNWPGGVLIVPFCNPESLLSSTCEEYIASGMGFGCAKPEYCNEGGYYSTDIRTNLGPECYCRDGEIPL